ncbi:hypothetical protein [Thermogemmatispora tikiterensis]|uniref:hypothetical protein n=1 Tax=Thermogemmatispora tikiterensis TaxID=1825093 RepID=UPI0016780E00|nr:hypothetical protein [Thermogemmatispora tikiterensis]
MAISRLPPPSSLATLVTDYEVEQANVMAGAPQMLKEYQHPHAQDNEEGWYQEQRRQKL